MLTQFDERSLAGGGLVHLSDYILGGGVACLLGTLFSLTGRALFYPINLFQQPKINYLGYYFFMGLCPFLITIQLLSIKLTFSHSLLLSIIVVLSISIIPYYRKAGVLWRDFIKNTLHTAFWVFIIGYLVLFLLNVIARNRGGPIYAELAQYITDTNSLPLLNRHHGQSILGAITLSIFRKADLSLALMCVNIWLPLSQAFLLLIIYSLTENIISKKTNRFIVCLVAYAGNCAFSLLPYIPSDHDFPLMFNIYADSVSSLGVSVVVVSLSILLLQNGDLKLNKYMYTSGLLYLLLASLNLSSELDMLVLMASLAPLFIYTVLIKKKFSVFPRLLIILLVASLAALSCNFMGGILMPKNRVFVLEHKNSSLFDDSNANSAVTTIIPTKPAWWYLPYVTPGFYVNFGNYESIFDGATIHNDSFNAMLMNAKLEGDNHLTKPKIVRAIYLIELRVATIFKVLFWPLLACCGCVWLLLRLKKDGNFYLKSQANKNEPSNLLISKTGISFSIASFLVGLSVILLNSHPGSALFWKWALTRLNEIGIFLMMVYTGFFCVLILDSIKSYRSRTLLTIALLSLLIGGAIIRLTVYHAFDG